MVVIHRTFVPVCSKRAPFLVRTSGVTPRADLLTCKEAPGSFHAWLDSSYYTFISLKEVFHIPLCNSILLAPHPAKEEENIKSKQCLKSEFFFHSE